MTYEVLTLLVSLLFVFLVFQIAFVLATVKKNNGLVDIFWGLGFVALASFLYFYAGFWHSFFGQWLVWLMVAAWGLRLTFHIYRRNANKPEDWRYKQWREDWGKWALPRAWIQVFVLQAFLQWVIAIPFIYTLSDNPYAALGIEATALIGFNDYSFPLIVTGFAIFVLGLTFEFVADRQLKKFLETKKSGEIMKSGLWRYSRHPNYFGEATLWWGIWLACYGYLGPQLPLWTLISPALITFLVRFVSGVPILERKYKGDKEFEKYKKETNVFIPLPVRK